MKIEAGTTAVITGGGSGLGRALALAFAGRGARLLLADVDEARANAVAEEVRRAGGEAFVAVADVSDAEAVRGLADRAYAALGRVDVLVNNAGVATGGKVGVMPLEDWGWILGINLHGVIYGCHAFLPRMREAGRGHVVNTASAAGFAAAPEMAAYNVTKAGVISLSETLHTELAPAGIGVTVLCPSFFKSDLLTTARFYDPVEERRARRAFERTKFTAEDIARSTVAAVEAERLYVVPQPDAKLIWRLKRWAPGLYAGLMRWGMRSGHLEKLADL